MKLGVTMLIHDKDDIEFVTEFPCFLGHPVLKGFSWSTWFVISLKEWQKYLIFRQFGYYLIIGNINRPHMGNPKTWGIFNNHCFKSKTLGSRQYISKYNMWLSI